LPHQVLHLFLGHFVSLVRFYEISLGFVEIGLQPRNLRLFLCPPVG
jgi:hypothetical protein